jgi:hypothetical protein
LYGTDVTGSFADNGKLSCWQTFTASGDDVKSAFVSLGKDNERQDSVIDDIEKYVCPLCQSQTHIVRVNELRWWLFSKKHTKAEKLPPSREALSGWIDERGEHTPQMSTIPPAPDAIMQTVKCSCLKCSS